MYPGLLHTHSALRYLVMLLLIVVILKSLSGVIGKKPFVKIDGQLSLFLLIATHLQFVIGLLLYFVSPFVIFGSQTMSEKVTRYWTVEHIFGMFVAVALITIAHSTAKKLTDAQAKHMRRLTLNFIALIVIIAVILMSGRKLIG